MNWIGWVVIGLGVLFQVLVPLGLVVEADGLWLSMPTQITAEFMATLLVVVGVIVVYLTSLKKQAEQADKSLRR